jgi:hypothetical protein
VAKPDTILAWYRKLVAHKFDGSKARRGPGRPRVTRKVERSATTKERATSCYFLGTGTSIVSGASNAASDWPGSCVIIIKRPHEKAVRWVF